MIHPAPKRIQTAIELNVGTKFTVNDEPTVYEVEEEPARERYVCDRCAFNSKQSGVSCREVSYLICHGATRKHNYYFIEVK